MSFDAFDWSDLPDPLESFGGMTRLFPLPNVVLFPGVLLPLHIFEPRYRQMVADALDTDRLITIVLLKPGYESDYEASPPIHEVGCLGQIVHHELRDDGRSNLIIRGLCRVRIDAEEPNDQIYRVAQVSILADQLPETDSGSANESVERVLSTMTHILTLAGRSEDAEKLSSIGAVPPNRVCDLACHCLGFDVSVKQALLAELDVAQRAETLLAWMEAILQSMERRVNQAGNPPDFSAN